jgi:hypothetical protein
VTAPRPPGALVHRLAAALHRIGASRRQAQAARWRVRALRQELADAPLPSLVGAAGAREHPITRRLRAGRAAGRRARLSQELFPVCRVLLLDLYRRPTGTPTDPPPPLET